MKHKMPILQRSSLVLFAMALGGALLVASCSSGGGGNEPAQPGAVPPGAVPPGAVPPGAVPPGGPLEKAQVSNGLDDALFGTALYSDGSSVEYIGSRDGNGIPIALTQVVVDRQGESISISLDGQSRPLHVQTSSGGVMTLEYRADGQIVAGIVTPGGEQVSTTVNAVATMAATPKSAIRVPSRYPLAASYVTYRNEGTSRSALATALPDSSVGVSATSCGAPVSLYGVFVQVSSLGGPPLNAYAANPVGGGQYIATIPRILLPTEGIQDVANGIKTALGVACTASQVLPGGGVSSVCSAVTLAAAPLTPAGQSAVAAICASGAAATNLYCSFDGSTNPSIDGLIARFVTDPLLDRVIESIGELQNVPNVSLTAFALGQSTTFPVASATAPKDGPYPALPLTGNSTPRITGLTLAPSAPAQAQPYVATGTVSCVATGTDVSMDIVGTDHYQNSIHETASADASSADYVLNVPGAESGVQDTVTITVKDSAGTQIDRRQASLVFTN